MTKKLIILTLTIFALLMACDNSKRLAKLDNSAQQIDTTKAIKIGNYWVTPKPLFEFRLRQQLPFQFSFWMEQLKKGVSFGQIAVSHKRLSMLSVRLSGPQNFGC